MKIAMIGHKRIPSREGGIEVVVEELAVRMAAKGHRVDAYNRFDDWKMKFPKRYKGVRIYKVPTIRHSAGNAFIYSVLAVGRAVFCGYDVIHIHAEGPAAMVWLPKLLGIPAVVTIHGLDWQRGKWGAFASRYLKFGERMAAKKSDALIVLSKQTKEYFRETYGRKAIYIPNGVSKAVDRKPDTIRQKWNLEEKSYILFAARLVPEKGLHYLIKAFKEIRTDKKLVIAGKIEAKSAYVQEICREASGDSRIIMTDFVEGEALEELFSNCCIYVIPSDVEGMAMSLLEALSYGAMCLASDIKENQGIADSYITFFQKGSVPDLKRKLEELLNQGKNGFDPEEQRRYMEKHFSWEAAVEQTLSVYKKVKGR